MTTIGADMLETKYGSALAVAEALLRNEIDSHEQEFVNEVVSRIILEAAKFRVEHAGKDFLRSKVNPPLPPGTRIVTTKPNVDLRRDWTEELWSAKKCNARLVIAHNAHDSVHKLWYDVRHDDGSRASYDPTEFEIAR